MDIREQRKNTILQLINDPSYKPMKQKELAFLLQVPSESRENFHDLLMELVDEGRIIHTKRGKFQSLSSVEKTGIFTGNQRGYGFVSVEDEEEDYYISDASTHGALNGDRVLITIVDNNSGRRKEAKVVKVIERANNEVVGYYKKYKNFGFVIPDDRKLGEDIYIPDGKNMNSISGNKVVARITRYGDNEHKAEGEIVEILGHVKDPGTDIISIIRAHDIPVDFSDKVLSEMKNVCDVVTVADIEGRRDLRDVLMVTIDGEDSKDFDDAVSLRVTDNGYKLGVHIADVSHYVKEGTMLDKEALERGTSVYLVDRVIPMLPTGLSNGICSLNEGQDRLALSCIMDIDKKGKVRNHIIEETVINVNKRLTYNKVYDILERSESKNEEADIKSTDVDNDIINMLVNMKKLSDILRTGRHERGSIDFDFPEAVFKLGKDGRPIDIMASDRNTAHKIIEDFMLIANETVAEDYYWQEIPFEFRVHEKPDREKVNNLKRVIEKFGYYLKSSSDEIHPKELQKLLASVEGSEEENYISRMVLRSMKQARYDVECSGHFGLAARYYCHFTSPIRRYPDLMIHRIIKENINGRLTDEHILHYNKILPDIAGSNSNKERRAEETEREVEKLKKVQYMSRQIGNEYVGHISGVTGYGLYVELDNTVEGLVRIASIPDDYYIYDEENMMIFGTDTGKVYQMGQKIKVKVVDTDMRMLTIDFEIVL